MPSALVLDVETAPDRTLLAAKGLNIDASESNPKLHCLTAYACFQFQIEDTVSAGHFAMISSLVAPNEASAQRLGCQTEAHALRAIGALLQNLGQDGLLVTFNGRHHDLPFLSMRQRQMCGTVQNQSFVSPPNHLDMMHLWRKMPCSSGQKQMRNWPSMKAACASVGIPHNPHGEFSDVYAVVRKCETDVLATFLLYLLQSSQWEQEAARFCEGWTALARWCLKGPHFGHRTQFAFCEGARASIRRTLDSAS